jgi:hypothetical protein
MAYGNVLNVGRHPVDLNDGRVLGHGEHAMNIDVDNPHNKSQIDAGHLRVIESAPVVTPRNADGSTNEVAPKKEEVTRDA